MRSALALLLLVVKLSVPQPVRAQPNSAGSCTMAFQQRTHDTSQDPASIVDACLVKALQAAPEKWRCRVVTIDPEALRVAFEDHVDTSTTWQRMKVQNSDRLYAQQVGRALKVDHILLSSLNMELTNALTGSNAALAQFSELMASGTHITDPRAHAFKHFQYKVILVETRSGKTLWHFTYGKDLTKPETVPFSERIAVKFLRRSPLKNE